MFGREHIVVLTGFLFAFKIDSYSCVECYVCSSPIGLNLDCQNNLDEIPIAPCFAGFTCARYTLIKGTSSILSRGCYPQDICQRLSLQYAKNPVVTVSECKVCDQDRCNSSSMNKIFFLSTLVTIMIISLI